MQIGNSSAATIPMLRPAKKIVRLLVAFSITILSVITVGFVQPLTAHAADAVTITGVQGQMANQIGKTSGATNCITYKPALDSASTTWVAAGQEAMTGHGVDDATNCRTLKGVTNTSHQSVLSFTPQNPGSVALGTPFVLGALKHYNNPVKSADTLFSGVLNVRLLDTNFEIPWTMNETSNTGGNCCDDITDFTVKVPPTQVTIDGLPYRLVVRGVSSSNSANGTIIEQFVTQEGTTTTGYLVASLEQVRQLTVKKIITGAPQGWAGATNVTIAASSTLQNSPWNTTITLQPDPADITTYSAFGPKQFLVPTETITLTETALPAGMELSGVNCVDAANNPVPGTTYAGRTATIKAPRATTVSQLNITCTFANSPVLQPLTVSKTTATSLTRDYNWALTKTVDPATDTYIAKDASQKVTWNVTAEALAPTDRDHVVSGKITVSNPNVGITFAAVKVADPGCSIVGYSDAGVIVPGASAAGPGTKVLDYSCAKETAQAGTNTATIAWDGYNTKINGTAVKSASSGAIPFDFTKATVTDGKGMTAALADSRFDYAATLNWAEVYGANAHKVNKVFSEDVAAKTGTCVPISNSATLNVAGAVITKDAATKICNESGPSVLKSVSADFQRTYDWGIEKKVTNAAVDPTTNTASVDFKVITTEKNSAETGFAMSGMITLTNPNDHEILIDGVKDTITAWHGTGATANTSGVSCPVNNPPTKLAANQEAKVSYTCVFPSTFSTGLSTGEITGTNQAEVVWRDRLGTTRSVTMPVGFTLKETKSLGKTVVVEDAAAGKKWNYTWSQPGAVHEENVTMTKPVAKGTCVTIENEAKLGDLKAPATKFLCNDGDPEVIPTAGSYNRDYQWKINKTVDKSKEIVQGDAQAEFKYLVTATNTAMIDTQATAAKLSLKNPNDFKQMIAVVELTPAAGLQCNASPARITLAQSATENVGISCVNLGITENKTVSAKVTFTDADPAATTAPIVKQVSLSFVAAQISNAEVNVVDDKTTQTPQRLGTVTVSESPKTFSYSIKLGAQPGSCSEYVNHAAIDAVGAKAEAKVEVCSCKEATAVKTAVGQYDREFVWSLHKTANPQGNIDVKSGAAATIQYNVVAKAEATHDSNKLVNGTVVVTNHNNFSEIQISSFKDLFGGQNCVLQETLPKTIAASSDVTLHYSCSNVSVDPSDYAGKIANTATLVVDGKTIQTNAAPVTFIVDKKTNETITVSDSLVPITDATLTWATGLEKQFSYSYEAKPQPGECLTVKNTAQATAGATAVVTSSTQNKVCAYSEPTVIKEVTADFSKTYGWNFDKIAKGASVDQAGKPVLKYELVTTEGAENRANYHMSGTITVHNPNQRDLVVTVSDIPIIDGIPADACTVTNANKVTLGPLEQRTFDYSCKVPQGYQGDLIGTNKARVTWSDPTAAEEQSVESVKAVAAIDTRFNPTVSVQDLMQVQPAGKFDYSWSKEGTRHIEAITWSPDEVIALGSCKDFTNKASLTVGAQMIDRQATQKVCRPVGTPAMSTATTINAKGNFNREYLWDINKTVDQPRINAAQGAASYTINVTGTEIKDTDHQLTGSLVITNPNQDPSIPAMNITVNLEKYLDAPCAIVGSNKAELSSRETKTFLFACDGSSLADKTNQGQGDVTAAIKGSLTWVYTDNSDQGTARFETPATLKLLNVVNKQVSVTDSMVDLSKLDGGNVLTWKKGSYPFSYAVALSTNGHQPLTFDNTARLVGDSNKLIKDVKASVTLTPPGPVVTPVVVHQPVISAPLARTGGQEFEILAGALLMIIGGGALLRRRSS